MNKQAVVIHSGGMDSSICLALAAKEFGRENVLSLSFSYTQRHAPELVQAEKICRDWKIEHCLLHLDCLSKITHNALMDKTIPIVADGGDGKGPNTLVIGRNGLMAHIGGIHADSLGAHCIYMGVMELEEANSGYRDCSRLYMDLQQQLLQIDLDDPLFEIRTPLIKMTKKETMEFAAELGILTYVLKETISCYEGFPGVGCTQCPACFLRNRGIQDYLKEHPAFEFEMPYLFKREEYDTRKN